MKISYADCLGLCPAVSMHFTLKMCAAATSRKKSPKQHFGGFKVVQVHQC